MAQDVDYTLIRGTVIALSQFLTDALSSSLQRSTPLLANAVSSALSAWNTQGKLSSDDVSSLSSAILSSLDAIPSEYATATQSAIKDALVSWSYTDQSQDIPLSTINADFESNRNDLYALLNQFQDPAFTEFMISGTGAQLIYLMATAQTMNQVGMELAIRENFVTLAQQASSVYAGLTNQGVRLARKNPAHCTATLTTTDPSTSIPPYTQFSINGTNYFNRDQIFWTPKLVQTSYRNSTSVTTSSGPLSISANLYEGTLIPAIFTSNGLPFIQIEVGNKDWSISNDDVIVMVNGVKWERTAHNLHYSMGLYNYGADNVWTEYTNAAGNCVIQFGDGINGNIPESGASIQVFYVETSGYAGNNFNLSSTVSCSSYAVTGTVIDYSQGGADSRSIADYKAMAPSLFSSQSRPCSITDYAAFVCNYPGIIDSAWLGQQQFAPNDPSQAMVIKGVLLTTTPWDDRQLSDFRDWLTGSGQDSTALAGANIYPELYLANAVPFDVQVQVYVKPYANENQIRSAISDALRAQYTAAFGVLNRKVALSDMEGIIKNLSVDGIDYYDVQLPTSDIDIAWDSYAVLNNITLQLSPTDRR